MDFCPQSVAWGDAATWIAGAGTIALGFLAWKTSQRATEIAQQQHEHHVDERKESARITGRLLFNELCSLPIRTVAALRALTAAIDWQDGNQIRNVTAVEHALRDLSETMVPNAEAVIDRIHHLPHSLGADLASLIGVTRSMQAMAQSMAKAVHVVEFPMRKALYAGSLTDFDGMHRQVSLVVELALGLSGEWQDFVGVERIDDVGVVTEWRDLTQRAGYEAATA